jgi:hypothetical protein
LGCLFGLKLLEGLWVVVWGHDLIINDERAFIDTHNLHLRSVDAEGSSDSVNESCCTTSAEELAESPLHSNLCLDGISWFDLQLTARGNVELKDILDTDESVFTAEGLSDGAVAGKAIVPSVVSDLGPILVDTSRLGSWVGDPDCGSNALSQ